MARLNISVPDEMKAKMDGLNLNWSAIAQQAFEHKLRLEELKGDQMNDMEQAGLARLRQGKKEADEVESVEGISYGTEYALNDADYAELGVYAEIAESHWRDRPAALRSAFKTNANLPDFESVFGEGEQPSEAFIQGFLDGCKAVFDKV